MAKTHNYTKFAQAAQSSKLKKRAQRTGSVKYARKNWPARIFPRSHPTDEQTTPSMAKAGTAKKAAKKKTGTSAPAGRKHAAGSRQRKPQLEEIDTVALSVFCVVKSRNPSDKF